MESLQKDKTFTISNIVKPHQTHTDKVEVVNSTSDTFENVDGVITNKENILLCTSSADCTSLFFYDDEKKRNRRCTLWMEGNSTKNREKGSRKND